MTKTKPPERIWAYDDGAHVLAFDFPTTIGGAVEYVRADIAHAHGTPDRLLNALVEIRELNMSGEDENGHRWANSDLIEQTIVFALPAIKGERS